MVDEYLLDTNVLSEPRRPGPDAGVKAFFAATPPEKMFVSVVSLAEIRYGIQIAQDPAFRVDIEHWLQHELRPLFPGRVLPITENVMLCWRTMFAEGRKRRRTFTQPDLLIAATASEHGLTIVTRNVKDFDGLSLNILNPWTGQP